jgi:hypothetical protein
VIGRNWPQRLFLLLGIGLLLLSFNNCGSSFHVIPLEASAEITQGSNILPADSDLSKKAGVFDPNCLNNSNYDACVIWKNPVAAQNRVFPAILQRATDLKDSQNFGVMLTNRKQPGKLESTTVSVSASAGTTPVFENGRLRIAYANDYGKSWLAQIMAYFWITYQETEMIRRTGVYFAKGKNIPVDAFATDEAKGAIPGNAYYSPTYNRVVMGYAEANNTIAHELALSAEVYLHEMGHANLEWALDNSGIDIYLDNNATYLVYTIEKTYTLRKSPNDVLDTDEVYMIFCKSADGCMWAINEGQADFHHLMIFSSRTALGETVENSLAGGFNSGTALRDVSLTKEWTAQQFYTSSGRSFNSGTITVNGEVHGMGSAYASILWSIYTHPDMKRSHFEKIFMEHLKLMSSNSRFQDARDSLVAIAEAMADDQFEGAHYGPLITKIFVQKGVAP